MAKEFKVKAAEQSLDDKINREIQKTDEKESIVSATCRNLEQLILALGEANRAVKYASFLVWGDPSCSVPSMTISGVMFGEEISVTVSLEQLAEEDRRYVYDALGALARNTLHMTLASIRKEADVELPGDA